MPSRSNNIRFRKSSIGAAFPLAAVALGGISSQATSNVSPIVNSAVSSVTNQSNVPTLAPVCFTASAHVSLRPQRKWTDVDENEFLRLAKSEALGKASPEELIRLGELSNIRTDLKHNYTLEELIWYAQQEKARAELLEAMQRFLSVQFSSPWASAKEFK